MTPYEKPEGRESLARAFLHAFQGIGYAVRTQRNMKIHIVIAACAIVMCFVLRCTTIEWCIVVAFIALVLAAEMLNTAIESLVDLVSPQYDIMAKRAKDTAAAAVLVLAIGAVVAGLIIFVTAILRLL